MTNKKSFKLYILTLLLILIASNCFSQWKTSEANNIKGDMVIIYEVIYDRELSFEEKNSSAYLSEITLTFNKDKMIERKFGYKPTAVNTYSLFDFNDLKAYSCSTIGDMKKAIKYDFKDPKGTVVPQEDTVPKKILGFSCEKGVTIINNKPKEIYYTKKVGLKYCQEFKIDGFLLEYPRYSKTLGHYTVKAKKIIYENFPNSFYSLDDFEIQTDKEYKKLVDERAAEVKEISIKYIGQKAFPIKDISIKNEKIDTKKMLGDIIVYNFWFTTCAPCKAEIPKLNQLREKYKDKNVHFVAIALDPEYKINEFTQKNPLNYDIIAEGRWIAEKFEITGYPTNIVVDKKGVIQFYDVGYKSDIVERVSNAIDKNLVQ